MSGDNDYIIPNFAGKKVREVESAVPKGIKVKVRESSETTFHDPTQSQLALSVKANGPGSQPGDAKTSGEWVNVIINPV